MISKELICFLFPILISTGFFGQSTNRQYAASVSNGTTANSKKEGIKPWSENNNYWEYKGKPVLLLGGFNHGHNPFVDGSTLDTIFVDDINVIIHEIDEMVKAGGNVLRCVLDPGSAVKDGIDSYRRVENGKFDLNYPEGEYWERLSRFIVAAEKRDVIVELEIWDRFDWQEENWKFSPFNPANNVNYSVNNTNLRTSYQRREIYHNHPMALGVTGHPKYKASKRSIKEKFDLVRHYQEIYVSKIYSLSKVHKNVLYNMNNETSEHPAWGAYWIKYLKTKAKNDGKEIMCTNMCDDLFNPEKSEKFKDQLNHPEIYDYIDASQANSRSRDEQHWEKVKYIVDQANKNGFLVHMTKLYGNDDFEPAPWSGWKPGDSDNAIEEWWHNLILGVAGVRFHRPTGGIGLSDKAKACITATRKIESKVKFWNVTPKMELFSDRDFDEAYLAADPGKNYILYFTHQGAGSIGLDLKDYNHVTFRIFWVNVDTGNWGPKEKIKGGSIQKIDRPDSTAHWVAAITGR